MAHSVGVLRCTELMFIEHARAYGRAGAEVIVVPRAAGQLTARWKTACAMAAIVSGCYVVTSNRSGTGAGSARFGGSGMAFEPNGDMAGETNGLRPMGELTFDASRMAAQQKLYPCYVSETWNVAQP